MKRLPALAVALLILASACNYRPLDDPGLGDLGLTTIVYAADGSVLTQWHAEEDRVLQRARPQQQQAGGDVRAVRKPRADDPAGARAAAD